MKIISEANKAVVKILGKTKPSDVGYREFVGIVLRIGLAVLFGITFKMEYFGFWLGDALAGFTPFFVGMGFYLSGRWKKCTRVAGDN